MKSVYQSLCLILLGLSPVSMFAADPAADTAFNRVHLQASSSTEVNNDLMVVHLAVELENTDPVILAEQVNSTMAWALDKVTPVKQIKYKTGGYSTQPVYHKTAIQRWRASQILILESADSKLLAGITAALQQKLLVKNIHFLVSDAIRRKTENELITTALEAFKQRADIIRTKLGAKGYRIVNMNVNTAGHIIRPVMEERFSAARAPVATAGGTSDVSVTVSGVVQLEK